MAEQKREYPKDTMVVFKNTTVSEDSKGRDRLKLVMTPEEVTKLIEVANGDDVKERGLVFTIHTGDQEKNGRTWKSSFGFVRALQANPFGGGGVPKAAATDDAVKAKIEALKKGTRA